MAKRRRQRQDHPLVRRTSGLLSSPHPLLAALALLVVGARWWLIGSYSPMFPGWTSGMRRRKACISPGARGRSVYRLFAPHNEHRIFFTRVLSLGLLWLNEQWDPRLQMVVNAGLYAILVAALFLFLRRGRSPGFQVFCWLLLAVLGSAPYAATNTLLGFQSQFYFPRGLLSPGDRGLGEQSPRLPVVDCSERLEAAPPWFDGFRLCGRSRCTRSASLSRRSARERNSDKTFCVCPRGLRPHRGRLLVAPQSAGARVSGREIGRRLRRFSSPACPGPAGR